MPSTVLVLGAGSMVGSDFVAGSGKRFDVVAVGRTDPRRLGLAVHRFEPLDLSEEEAVRRFLSQRAGDTAWVNFAARTDVDGCEAERPEDASDRSRIDRPDSAWRLNAALPGWLAEESERQRVPLVHLSTDFVFDGSRGPYVEEAQPSPLSKRVGWYGYTKGVGEGQIRATRAPYAIVRISYPYRTEFAPKADFARNLLERGRKGQLYPLYTDQVITPTWIPDVTMALLAMIPLHVSGTYHVASPEPTTPLGFAEELFRTFRLSMGPLPRTAMASRAVAPGKAPRPLHGGLGISRVRALGVEPTGFRAGIARMAARLDSRG